MGVLAAAWLASAVLAAEPPAAPERYRSRLWPSRVWELPGALLELPWQPLRRGLDWAERNRLDLRLRGLFYFNARETAGWVPAYSNDALERGGGAEIFHEDVAGRDEELSAGFGMFRESELFAKAAYERPPRRGRRWTGAARLRHARGGDVPFYARGAGRGERRGYSLRRWEGSAEALRLLSGTLRGGLRLSGLSDTAEAADAPPPAPGPPGFADTATLLGGDLLLVRDGRDDPWRPTAGTLLAAELGAAASPGRSPRGARYGLFRQALRAEGYGEVLVPRRVVALSAGLERAGPAAGGAVPFSALPLLDVDAGLRSFVQRRFQDRVVARAGAEYRFPVWAYWDAFLFIESGQAVDDPARLRPAAARVSKGLGLRVHAEGRYFLNLHQAWGSEGGLVQVALGRPL